MIAGIIAQYRFGFHYSLSIIIVGSALIASVLFSMVPDYYRHRYSFINGVIASIIFFSFGCTLTWQKDIRNDNTWIGHIYTEQDAIIATLDEPPVLKTRSLKSEAIVQYLVQNGQTVPVKGKIIIYFEKDVLADSTEKTSYGSQVLFKKKLQEIKNSGNPGGFDYKRYCLFHGITHQVFLKKGEFEILPGKKENGLKKFLYSCREWVLGILQKNISSRKELGLAEALLIGYKGDLDQALVQSYTNTGVVHIIAISGLHLGLIYWLLILLFKPLQKNKKLKWLPPLLIISGLWLFTLLAGAQPSVLRSAIMFTCMVVAQAVSRKSSIYNTMAVSAFVLLCINPFWLWDVGFQLSFAAVLSIVIFMQPIYNWFYCKNKILDFIWKMNAVTLAAQILTAPLSIYHFHQFPTWFLLTNFIAVPLSSIILLGEIFLCFISFIPTISVFTGKILGWLIQFMNSYIEKVETLPLSLWDGLQVNIAQVIYLFVFIAGMAWWSFERYKPGLKIALVSLLFFTAYRSWSFIQADAQQKIIVYNVPQKKAIDIIHGRETVFIGDSSLLVNDFARNFHLKPARVLYRTIVRDKPENLWINDNYITCNNKHILLLDERITYIPGLKKEVIDLLVISGKPKLNIPQLSGSLEIKQIVFDGSVPSWKADGWKKECDSLRIPWYDVTKAGAFEMGL